MFIVIHIYIHMCHMNRTCLSLGLVLKLFMLFGSCSYYHICPNSIWLLACPTGLVGLLCIVSWQSFLSVRP